MDTLRLDNALKEMERIAGIIFTYGSAEQLEQLMDKLGILSEDARDFYQDRQQKMEENG